MYEACVVCWDGITEETTTTNVELGRPIVAFVMGDTLRKLTPEESVRKLLAEITEKVPEVSLPGGLSAWTVGQVGQDIHTDSTSTLKLVPASTPEGAALRDLYENPLFVIVIIWVRRVT